jgi:hypothetical protein
VDIHRLGVLRNRLKSVPKSAFREGEAPSEPGGSTASGSDGASPSQSWDTL